METVAHPEKREANFSSPHLEQHASTAVPEPKTAKSTDPDERASSAAENSSSAPSRIVSEGAAMAESPRDSARERDSSILSAGRVKATLTVI